MVRRGGPHDEQVDRVSRDGGGPYRTFARFDSQIGRGLVGSGDSPLFDARARDDPFLGCIDHPLEVGVGEDRLGEVRAHPDYLSESLHGAAQLQTGVRGPCGSAVGEVYPMTSGASTTSTLPRRDRLGDALREVASHRASGHRDRVRDGGRAR